MEAMDANFWRDCPAVEVDPQKLHGEPTVGGYRLAATTLVEAEELGQSPESTAEEYDIPVDLIRAILDYYHAHQPQLTSSL